MIGIRPALLASTVLAVLSGPAMAQDEPPEVTQYTDRADALARQEVGMVGDLTWFSSRYCHPTDEEGSAAAERRLWQSMVIPPTRVFDNFYYVGHGQYGAWVIETSEGLILIDALNSPDEGREYIEAGMEELGLDPTDLRYLLVMHGHGDHWGAGYYLQQKYDLTVGLGAEDWTLLEDTDPGGVRGPPPVRDLVIEGDTVITLGDTNVRFFSTPGHTPGGLSALITVEDGDREHTVAYWGGTGLPGDPEMLALYQQSLGKFREVVAAAGADVLASNHPYLDTTNNALPLLGWREEGEPHPFVIGQEAVERYYEILDLCVSAELVRRYSVGRGGL
jgi:metallo-beta-lactamase class B